MITNANEMLFRSSQIGYIMPTDNPKVTWTDAHIDKLIEAFNYNVYDRRDEMTNKYFEKGNKREEDNITLLALKLGKMLRKNTVRLNNKFITGEPDLFLGPEIKKADETFDTKTCWSKNTYDKARIKKRNPIYFWQGHSYMYLTGAKKHSICYGLVNGLPSQILQEKYKAGFKFQGIDLDNNDEYRFACMQIERNHIFDIKQFVEENPGFDFHYDINNWKHDIPASERMFIDTFVRDEKRIAAIDWRVLTGRQWLNENMFNLKK